MIVFFCLSAVPQDTGPMSTLLPNEPLRSLLQTYVTLYSRLYREYLIAGKQNQALGFFDHTNIVLY